MAESGDSRDGRDAEGEAGDTTGGDGREEAGGSGEASSLSPAVGSPCGCGMTLS